MMVYEVSSYQYALCITHGFCHLYNIKSYDSGCRTPLDSTLSKANSVPVNCIGYDGAQEFCKWIGGRLPTEREWEYAATYDGSIALNTTYPWGDDTPQFCYHATWLEPTQICVKLANKNKTSNQRLESVKVYLMRITLFMHIPVCFHRVRLPPGSLIWLAMFLNMSPILRFIQKRITTELPLIY